MNKSKKGFLTAASIISIVGCGFAILLGLFMFLAGSMATEEMIKESYKSDPEYTYYEEADGSYYFTEIEDGVLETTTEENIEMLSNIVSKVLYVSGVVILAISIAKMVLAIRILLLNGRDKYAKGSVIALLVLSLINSNLLEAILLIVAMYQKDEIKSEQQPLGLDDIKLDDIS